VAEGKLAPVFKTIAGFRRDNGEAVRATRKHVGLIAGGTVAVDGSRFGAVNTRDKNYPRCDPAPPPPGAGRREHLALPRQARQARQARHRQKADVAEMLTTRVKRGSRGSATPVADGGTLAVLDSLVIRQGGRNSGLGLGTDLDSCCLSWNRVQQGDQSSMKLKHFSLILVDLVQSPNFRIAEWHVLAPKISLLVPPSPTSAASTFSRSLWRCRPHLARTSPSASTGSAALTGVTAPKDILICRHIQLAWRRKHYAPCCC
jgi:hypothetical protein